MYFSILKIVALFMSAYVLYIHSGSASGLIFISIAGLLVIEQDQISNIRKAWEFQRLFKWVTVLISCLAIGKNLNLMNFLVICIYLDLLIAAYYRIKSSKTGYLEFCVIVLTWLISMKYTIAQERMYDLKMLISCAGFPMLYSFYVCIRDKKESLHTISLMQSIQASCVLLVIGLKAAGFIPTGASFDRFFLLCLLALQLIRLLEKNLSFGTALDKGVQSLGYFIICIWIGMLSSSEYLWISYALLMAPSLLRMMSNYSKLLSAYHQIVSILLMGILLYWTGDLGAEGRFWGIFIIGMLAYYFSNLKIIVLDFKEKSNFWLYKLIGILVIGLMAMGGV